MREHQTIIDEAGGPAKVARAIGAEAGTVKQWKRSNSIPSPYWRAMATADFASLDELADAAAKRKATAQAVDGEAA